MYAELALLAGFVFLYSAVAGGIERTMISGPMVFTIFGLVVGPLGVGYACLAGQPESIPAPTDPSAAREE